MPSNEFTGVEWIFFDWGGTLKDEIAIYRDIARVTGRHMRARGVAIDSEQLFNRLIEIEKAEQRIGLLDAMAEFDLADEHFDSLRGVIDAELHLNNSYAGVESVMASLSTTHRLGVISNNNIRGFENFLAAENFLSYFGVIVGSTDAGIRKPDPRIFLLALERAGCRPHRAAMVGDRLNKDIVGANRVGMRTVRIRQGIYAHEEPQVPDEKPDAEITDIRQLPDLFL